MRTTKVKICGLSSLETVAAAIDAGASHIGFNFYPPSPRIVSPQVAAPLAQIAKGRVQIVGVFVDADDDYLKQSIEAGQLDALQLHGKESPERVRDVKARFGLPVWKVLSVERAEDVERAGVYSDVADFLLFDARTPPGALPGGMGIAFDRDLLKAYDGTLDWGLAGGLTPGNVAEAIRATGASLVDTASGVESAPGVKDVDKIAAFCKAAHSV